MDGNGRWAERNQIARALGHREGVKSVKRVVKAALTHQVEVLTVYAFSTENWKRPQQEVSYLMDLLFKTLVKELDALHKQGVKLSFIGQLQGLPPALQEQLARAKERTKENDALHLVIALNYGSRAEIVDATKSLGSALLKGEISLDEITEERFAQELYLPDLPEVDLLIRTSGELRLSNFLLWQLAYAELYFTECHWPEFGETQFAEALAAYAERDRRFGGR